MVEGQEIYDMPHPLIQAIRLKTLPLAAGAMLLGASVAKIEGNFNTVIFILGLSTAFLLQILSNLANDYGDFMHGIDGAERSDRALSSGKISPQKMRLYLILNVILVLLSGTFLLLQANKISSAAFWPMFGIGILCILGAIFYTMGKKPYGYVALGDLSVLLFFGPVAVAGSYYLYSGSFSFNLFLPALFSGFVSAGVLNVNNIRDIASDFAAGKRSLAMIFGDKNARLYHLILLHLSWVLLIIFNFQNSRWAGFTQLITFVFMELHLRGLMKAETGDRPAFNKQLKNLSLLFLFSTMLTFILL